MRLEDLMKLSDGFHNKENKIILKQGNIIKILDEDNHSLFAKIMNPKIKTANKETKELDLDYKGMLQQMFPGGKLIQTKNRQDCFFDEYSKYERYTKATELGS